MQNPHVDATRLRAHLAGTIRTPGSGASTSTTYKDATGLCRDKLERDSRTAVRSRSSVSSLTPSVGNSEVAPPGVAPGWTSTWFQGQPNQPSAHPAPAVSNCQNLNYVGQSAQQLTIVGPATPSSSSSSALPTTSSTSSSIPLVTATTSANVYVASTMFGSSSTALPAAPSSLTGAAGRTSVFAPLILFVLGFALFL